MLYYRLLGKRILITAHNVNSGKRDANDNFLNWLGLKAQYGLAHHIFVHTERMKKQLLEEFAPDESKVSVIPFGINNTVPQTKMTSEQARESLGIGRAEKVLLFFGHIAPYKGLDYLISALKELLKTDAKYRLIIAGSGRSCPDYWKQVQAEISSSGVGGRMVQRIEFIPDNETEVYFKAADVSVLPYTDIFQSGVLVLSYSFGLPVIAADVGSLREDIVEGRTGFVFRPKDAADLVATIERYFSSALYSELESRRQDIRDYAHEKYSWAKVGEITTAVYRSLTDRSEELETAR
jgi:glycosyltransferase involved in cell wall biosynthesis